MSISSNEIYIKSIDSSLSIKKMSEDDKVIAIAGNPNVGKSTVFNALTGLKQHTGNWPGKTVTNAQGLFTSSKQNYVLIDIPGTYSLMAHSAEEEVARNFICFGNPNAVVVVCDATCLERNINLVLQTIEISTCVIVCVNMMDEAKRKNIFVDLSLLSKRLGVPVVGTTAHKKKSLNSLIATLDNTISECNDLEPYSINYDKDIEYAISLIEPVIRNKCDKSINSRWLSLRLLDKDESLINEIEDYFGPSFLVDEELNNALSMAYDYLAKQGIDNGDKLKDQIVTNLVNIAEEVCKGVVVYGKRQYNECDRRLDRLLTSKITGYPVMLLLLAFVFWLTITGANYPSMLLSNSFNWIQERLTQFFMYIHAPDWLHGILVLGIYRVLTWVISVMLPPMLIFFPLFTLLEDSGYLPRVAYNLDKPFNRCSACGKQALCMSMGFGCNAAGVIGCRIIDSPRERLLAILTNNFVPCNGRFPTLISIITMFFVGAAGGFYGSLWSSLLLTTVIVLGVIITLGVTKFLSNTLLKGIPSSFTLELPPYRKPQFGKVIVRSVCDRALFVLSRAIVVAAPAGLVIWLMANIKIGDMSILNHCTSFLDPFAKIMGLDGVILIAFILGLPANEIVIPIIIMAYMSQGSIMELENLSQMKNLFIDNGWTWITAISMILFSLNHWPCSTTLLTIKKETGSWKWTGIAALIPTVIGIVLCMIFANVARIFTT